MYLNYLFIFIILKFLSSTVINKNNRGCSSGFNNRMAVAVTPVEKCAIFTRLLPVFASLIHYPDRICEGSKLGLIQGNHPSFPTQVLLVVGYSDCSISRHPSFRTQRYCLRVLYNPLHYRRFSFFFALAGTVNCFTVYILFVWAVGIRCRKPCVKNCFRINFITCTKSPILGL